MSPVESGDSSRWDALPGGGSSSDSDGATGTAGLAAPVPRRGAIGSLSARAGDDTSAGGADPATTSAAATVRPAPDGASLSVTLPTLAGGTVTLTIAHDPAAGLAHRVWPSSLALAARAFAGGAGQVFAVELGCGPGLAGVAWAAAGARVVLTDLAPCLPLAERSVALSGLGDRATVARLAWGEPGGPALGAAAAAAAGWWAADAPARPVPDLLLAADVVYDPALFAPLLTTLADFGRAGTRRVLLAHVRRWKSDARFWKAARREWKVADVTDGGDGSGDRDARPGRRGSSHERGAQRVFELTWKGQ